METLLTQLKELPSRFQALPGGVRAALLAGVVVAVVVAAAVGVMAKGGEYQYAFTNLTQEDSTEATGLLKNAGIPFRVEAGGGAVGFKGVDLAEDDALDAQAARARQGGVDGTV